MQDQVTRQQLQTSLYSAAKRCDKGEIESLVESGQVDLNLPDENAQIPLSHAIKKVG